MKKRIQKYPLDFSLTHFSFFPENQIFSWNFKKKIHSICFREEKQIDFQS